MSAIENQLLRQRMVATLLILLDTAGQTLKCQATNAAGDNSTESITIKKDSTQPIITSTLQGKFFTDNPVPDWNCEDATSGISDGAEGCFSDGASGKQQ